VRSARTRAFGTKEPSPTTRSRPRSTAKKAPRSPISTGDRGKWRAIARRPRGRTTRARRRCARSSQLAEGVNVPDVIEVRNGHGSANVEPRLGGVRTDAAGPLDRIFARINDAIVSCPRSRSWPPRSF